MSVMLDSPSEPIKGDYDKWEDLIRFQNSLNLPISPSLSEELGLDDQVIPNTLSTPQVHPSPYGNPAFLNPVEPNIVSTDRREKTKSFASSDSLKPPNVSTYSDNRIGKSTTGNSKEYNNAGTKQNLSAHKNLLNSIQTTISGVSSKIVSFTLQIANKVLQPVEENFSGDIPSKSSRSGTNRSVIEKFEDSISSIISVTIDVIKQIQ